MPKGKIGTEDNVVAEMLGALYTGVLDHLADTFRMRITILNFMVKLGMIVLPIRSRR